MDDLQRVWCNIIFWTSYSILRRTTLTVGLCVFALLAGLLQRVLHQYKVRRPHSLTRLRPSPLINFSGFDSLASASGLCTRIPFPRPSTKHTAASASCTTRATTPAASCSRGRRSSSRSAAHFPPSAPRSRPRRPSRTRTWPRPLRTSRCGRSSGAPSAPRSVRPVSRSEQSPRLHGRCSGEHLDVGLFVLVVAGARAYLIWQQRDAEELDEAAYTARLRS